MLRFFCACAMISTMLLMLLFKGGLDVKSVNEHLKDMNGIEYQEAIDCYWEHFF